jgi:choline dehydrogenase-like flavoprotein
VRFSAAPPPHAASAGAETETQAESEIAAERGAGTFGTALLAPGGQLVISAGAVNTPALLQASGIGPPKVLAALVLLQEYA